MDPIVRRITKQLGAPDLVDALADLPASDLQSLLLAVVRRRAARRDPADLRRQAERSRLLAPSSVEARVLAELDRAAFAAAAGFTAVELSPVAPLGIDLALGGIDPNNVLATIRNSQLMADPTTSLALLCALRRRGGRGDEIKLCAAHRMIRLQPIDGIPDFTPHFKQFALVTAGRDRGGCRFEAASLGEHLAVYLELFRALRGQGYRFDAIDVAVSDTDLVRSLCASRGVDLETLRRGVHAHEPGGAARALAERGVELPDQLDELPPLPDAPAAHARLTCVRDQVLPALAARFPEVRFRIDGSRLSGLGYYRGLCLLVTATDPAGRPMPIGDGGFTTWTQDLLDDRKERLLTTGIGSEIIPKRFRLP